MMKLDICMERSNYPLLALVILTLFVFVISFTAFYTKENFSAACGCKVPIWIIVITMASFGMLVGSLVYFLLNKNEINEKKIFKSAIIKTLNFLDEDERRVFEKIVENRGQIYQSKISSDLKINKVKTFRILNQLEKKKIIRKEKSGMTNLIFLEDDLLKIF
jgi:hypothetical protein